MKTSIRQKLKKFIIEYGENNRWRKAAVCMAAFVAVLTVSALVLPALTIGREAYCGMEEHTHMTECYERQLVCGEEDHKEESGTVKTVLPCSLELHQHQAGCRGSSGELICGYADYVIHEHGEPCYDEHGMLVCELPEVKEHRHDPSCYIEEKRLVCALEESEEHTHTDDCYTTDRQYTCGKEEILVHRHDGSCCGKDDNGNEYLSCGRLETYAHVHDGTCFREVQEENGAHTHTEECYADVFVCEKAEHTHEESCFNGNSSSPETAGLTDETGENGRGSLICTLEGHIHEAACYSEAVPGRENESDQAIGDLPAQDGVNENFAAAGEAENPDTDLKEYLQSVTIQDKDGNPVSGTVYIGETYRIELHFAETEEKQFHTGVTTWTYQLPAGFKVNEVEKQKTEIQVTVNNTVYTYEVEYSISAAGEITLYLTDKVREEFGKARNGSFDVSLSAEVSKDNIEEGESIIFEGVVGGGEFFAKVRPTLTVTKTGEKTPEGADIGLQGGEITYTIRGNVENGPVNGLTFLDKAGYSEQYFGNLETIQNHFRVGPITISCEKNDSSHRRTLTDADYSYELYRSEAPGEEGKTVFALTVNENIRLDDCDTIEVKYTIPYHAAENVSYYWFDVDNMVEFGGNAIPTETDPDPGEVEKDTAENQVTLTGGTAGLEGIVKSIDSSQYENGFLHYTITVDVKKGEYKTFLLQDSLTILLGNETYKVDAEPQNLQIRVKDKASGTWTTLPSLADTVPDWHIRIWSWNPADQITFPPENYYGYWGKAMSGDQGVPGEYNILFNPVHYGDFWGGDTSLKLEQDSVIEVSYDIAVGETDLYSEDNVITTVNLKEYLKEKGAAILRNTAGLTAGGQWGSSTVDFSRGDKLRKSANDIPNEDGTVDYTVTLMVDDAVREKLNESFKILDGWFSYYDVVFQDAVPKGWEYVEGTLKATANIGYPAEFLYLDSYEEAEVTANAEYPMWAQAGADLSPVAENGSLSAPIAGFYCKTERGIWTLKWAIQESMANLQGITFTYKLRPTEAAGEGYTYDSTDPAGLTLEVINTASMEFNGEKLYDAENVLYYKPKIMGKTAMQQAEGSNLISFHLDINPAGIDLNPAGSTITVTDTMGTNLTYKPGSLKVTGETGELVSGYSLTTSRVGDEDGDGEGDHDQLKLTGLPDDRHLNICYEAFVTGTGSILVENYAEIEKVTTTGLSADTKFDVHSSEAGGGASYDYFTLLKVDQSNESKVLQDAAFEVYAAARLPEDAEITENTFVFGEETSASKYSAESLGTVVTDEKGEASTEFLSGIEIGKYYILKETEAPAGYVQRQDPILVYFAGIEPVPEDLDSNAKVIGISYIYTIGNESYQVELPETGGTGTVPYTMAGIALIATAALLYRKKQRRVRKVKG